MAAVVKIVDEHFGRGRSPAFELRLVSERTSVRELIAQRVREDVALANSDQTNARAALDRTRSFLIPFDASPIEAALNKPREAQKPRRFDETEEVEKALAAFSGNQYILLIDERQVGDLETTVTLTPESEVVFLRLTPLVGG